MSGKRVEFIILILLLLLMFYVVYKVNGQGACSYGISGKVFILSNQTEYPEGVTLDTLGRLETYFDQRYQPRGDRDHVFAFFSNNDEANAIINMERDWTGYSAMSLRGADWSWESCSRISHSSVDVDLTLMRIGFDNSALFGLYIHEIAATSNNDGHEGAPEDSVWWEREGNYAYQNRCGELTDELERSSCDDLRNIIDTVSIENRWDS